MRKLILGLIPSLLFGALLLARGFLFGVSAASGFWTVSLFAAFGIGAVLALRGLVVSVLRLDRARGVFRKITLLVSSVCLCAVVLEAGLAGLERMPASQKNSAVSLAAEMPTNWVKRKVQVEGARGADFWQGHLHVYDKFHMRQIGPIPDRRPDVCRIAAVGDSMTYGYGEDVTNTWPAALERKLQQAGFKAEVLNLGVSGAQSEYVADVVRDRALLLQPDLVIYGICLNDFLENGVRIFSNNMRAQIPLPDAWKKFVFERTRSGRLFSKGYNGLLMAIGVRTDFLGDILQNIAKRQKRFGKDLKRMNAQVVESNLPPVVAMVLDQFPEVGGRGQRLANIAEAEAQKAGMEVVPTADYYVKYSGRRMEVSQWEYHPNAEAYAIFADMIARQIATNPALAPFRSAR